MEKQNSIKIYYDGDCPFCAGYMKLVNLKNVAGDVVLVDLRTDLQQARVFAEQGLNVDDTMILDMNGHLYAGDQALTQIALMTTESTFFNKLNYALFKNPAIARLLYPALRAGRNAVLFLLRRKKILS